MKDCDPLIRPALERAFGNGISIQDDKGDCRIEFPHQRSDGDRVRVWVVNEGNGTFRITDEGETYGLLYLSNINLDQEKRENRIETIQERFDLDEAKQEICTYTTQDQLGSRLLDVAQAIQSISHLTFTRRQYTQTDFRADVGAYLTEIGYHFDSNPDVDGLSEKHRVDFAVRSQPQPTYLEALHAENASTARAMARKTAFKWGDIERRNPNVRKVSVIDDETGEFGHDAERILENWSEVLVPWSQRSTLDNAITG